MKIYLDEPKESLPVGTMRYAAISVNGGMIVGLACVRESAEAIAEYWKIKGSAVNVVLVRVEGDE